MCYQCDRFGIECGYPGNDCCLDEDSYLPPEEADLIINPPAYESKMSMSKKVEVEVDTDKNGIITKQSEVYVWNDTVFASYKSALAASKKSVIVEKLCRAYYQNAGYNEAQMKNMIKSWTTNPQNYNCYVSHAVDVFSELLAAE